MNTPSDESGRPLLIKKAALEHRLARGRGAVITVSGWSMLPFLPHGARIRVEPVTKDIELGDVVVYFLGDRLVVHRVVRITDSDSGRHLETKGDSVRTFDPRVNRREDLVGKVVGVAWGRLEVRVDTFPWRLAGKVIAIASFLVGWAFRPAGGGRGPDAGSSSKGTESA